MSGSSSGGGGGEKEEETTAATAAEVWKFNVHGRPIGPTIVGPGIAACFSLFSSASGWSQTFVVLLGPGKSKKVRSRDSEI